MVQASRNATQALDLGQVVRAVGRKFPHIAVGAAVVGALVAGVLSTMAPKYLSQAQLEITNGAPGEGGGRPDKEAVGTHVRGLLATDLALKMAKELKLTERSDFNSALEPNDVFGRVLRKIGVGLPKASETDEDRLLQAYYKLVRAYQVRETRSVIVDCTTSDAKFSAECANKLAELYRVSLRGRAVVENDDFRTKLAPQIDRLTREVAVAESDATQFRGKANLFQAGGGQAVQLKEQQLGELTAELTRAATARADIDARTSAAREMLARGLGGANPDVQRSALVPRLEESRVRLERQISELGATLLPAHPRMRQLSSELGSLQRQIRDEVQKVLESLSNDVRVAAEREASVRRRIEDMKKTVVSSASDTAQLSQIEAVAKSKRAELERVQKQFEAAQSTAKAGAVHPEVDIVSRAYASNEKVFPKIGTMAPLAALSALIFGLAWSFLREVAMGGSRGGAPIAVKGAPKLNASSAAQALDVGVPLPMAQTVAGEPQVVHAAKTNLEFELRAEPKATDHVSTPVIEAAAVLIANAKNGMAFRSLVTPQGESVDARSEAVELARALAASGRETVLVNWSVDKPIEFDGLQVVAGVAELLCGAASLDEALVALPGSSAKFVGAGTGVDAIDGGAACVLLDALDEIFEHVVVYASHLRARELFTAIEGRCDAGVVVRANGRSAEIKRDEFLGFAVSDFLVVPVTRGQRMAERVGVVPVRGLPNLSPYKPLNGRV